MNINAHYEKHISNKQKPLRKLLHRDLLKTVYHGAVSISNLGPKIWDLVPNSIKEIDSEGVFKETNKKWKPENCPCRLCKVYVQNVGFL